MPDCTNELIFSDEAATESFAHKLAQAITLHAQLIRDQGLNIRLTGDLGAGKTALTRALLRALGITGRVRSPTFQLVEDYDVLASSVLHHFDFYRFESPVEFEEAGFRDLFGPDQITVCEWSNKAGSYLPDADLEIELHIAGLSRHADVHLLSDFGTIIFNSAVSL